MQREQPHDHRPDRLRPPTQPRGARRAGAQAGAGRAQPPPLLLAADRAHPRGHRRQRELRQRRQLRPRAGPRRGAGRPVVVGEVRGDHRPPRRVRRRRPPELGLREPAGGRRARRLRRDLALRRPVLGGHLRRRGERHPRLHGRRRRRVRHRRPRVPRRGHLREPAAGQPHAAVAARRSGRLAAAPERSQPPRHQPGRGERRVRVRRPVRRRPAGDPAHPVLRPLGLQRHPAPVAPPPPALREGRGARPPAGPRGGPWSRRGRR